MVYLHEALVPPPSSVIQRRPFSSPLRMTRRSRRMRPGSKPGLADQIAPSGPDSPGPSEVVHTERLVRQGGHEDFLGHLDGGLGMQNIRQACGCQD